MSTQRYSVTPHPIETLLTWVKSGEIAIPEIQRPFVWEATKVRNLLDSLYQGYPVGYLIAWRNPSVKLKDGTSAAGKRILIDGQQRVTALMAALLGHEVLTKNYETTRIRIAFHPQDERFEVANPAIRRDGAWIEDVSEVFAPATSIFQLVGGYCTKNPGVTQDAVFASIEKLRKIINNHVGIIELADDLDIETVTEIFIRVNSAGTELSQADFAMSKIAVNETFGGNLLRKAIDYLLLNRSDMHHVYPKKHLQTQGLPRGRYNQIANFVVAQSEINIAIGAKPPEVYFLELAEQASGGKKRYGGIDDLAEMQANLHMSCVPDTMLQGEILAYEDFLERRRRLMALKIKTWFEGL